MRGGKEEVYAKGKQENCKEKKDAKHPFRAPGSGHGALALRL